MSALIVARSSARTSLLRYARSWGLWLVLLVAPVGARFMIADGNGHGIDIAVGDQLPVLTAAVLGVWLGIVVSTLLLPIGYAYLRSNTNRRQPWQVEDVTIASRVAIALGRFVADAAVLLAVLATLTLAGWLLNWLLVPGDFDPLALSYGLWMVAAPALIGVAALRILFDALPLLRGFLGDFAFFVLWMTAIVMPAANQGQASTFGTNMRDFAGYYRPMVAGSPAHTDDFAIGGVDVKPGRVKLDVMVGLRAPGYAQSRAAWAGIAVLVAALAGLVYRPRRPRRQRGPARGIAKLLSAGPPAPADPAAPRAPLADHPLLALIGAEARLIGAGRSFILLAMVTAAAGLFGDDRHIGSPAQLLLLIFALSAHAGRSEARGLAKLTATMPIPAMARRIAFVLAGTGLAVVLAVPAAATRLSYEPLLLGLTTGFSAALLATLLAMLSRSPFAPRLALLVVWYAYFST